MSIIHLNTPKLYEFNGISFEFSYSIGPWPLKKDGDPKARAGKRFYDSIHEWVHSTPEDQEKYRVGGGSQFFDTEAKE
jgi:hypothetical protein